MQLGVDSQKLGIVRNQGPKLTQSFFLTVNSTGSVLRNTGMKCLYCEGKKCRMSILVDSSSLAMLGGGLKHRVSRAIKAQFTSNAKSPADFICSVVIKINIKRHRYKLHPT